MGRHKSYDRAEVLERALKLFWEKGYEGAHLQELVEVTGLNRFSLYKEFGSKEGLFNEALEKYSREMESLAESLIREPRGLDNIRQYYQDVIKYPWHQGCFAINALTHHPAVPKQNREQLFKFFRYLETLMYKNLKAAQKQGELDKGINIRALAGLLVAIDMGVIISHILNPKREMKKNMVALINDRLLGRGQVLH